MPQLGVLGPIYNLFFQEPSGPPFLHPRKGGDDLPPVLSPGGGGQSPVVGGTEDGAAQVQQGAEPAGAKVPRHHTGQELFSVVGRVPKVLSHAHR